MQGRYSGLGNALNVMGNNKAWHGLGRAASPGTSSAARARTNPQPGEFCFFKLAAAQRCVCLIHQSVLSPPRFSLLYLWCSTLIPCDAQHLLRDFFLFFSSLFLFRTPVAGGGLRPSFEHSPSWLSAFFKCRAPRYVLGALSVLLAGNSSD